MKYFKIEVKDARVITYYDKSGIYSKDFFYPFNYKHVYNMLCTLLDKSPSPQNRMVDTKYMPFYEYIMEQIKNGYIKIRCISEDENITTIKTAYNSNAVNNAIPHYTWRDCQLTMGNVNFELFKEHLLQNYGIDYVKDGYLSGFTETMKKIATHKNQILINKTKIWFKSIKCTVLSNYIENHKDYNGTFLGVEKIDLKGAYMKKRVNRGIVTANVYDAIIYIPLTPQIKNEYDLYSKGWTNFLDGGIAKVVDICDITDADIYDYLKITELLDKRKSELFTKNLQDYKNEIYNNLIVKSKTYKVEKSDITELLESLELNVEEKKLNDLLEKNISIKTLTPFLKSAISKKYKDSTNLTRESIITKYSSLGIPWKDEYINNYDVNYKKNSKVIKPQKIVITEEKIIHNAERIINSKF